MSVCKNCDTVKYQELTINTLQIIVFISMSNIREGKVSLSKHLFASSTTSKALLCGKNKTPLEVSNEYFIALATCRVF